MDFTAQQRAQWEAITEEINAWYDHHLGSAAAQIGFQRENPVFDTFVLDSLAPSLLGGEVAFNRCIERIAMEPDTVLKFTYYLAASSVWDPLRAPANDVANDLMAQGWTLGDVRSKLQQLLVLPWKRNTNGMDLGAIDEPMLQ